MTYFEIFHARREFRYLKCVGKPLFQRESFNTELNDLRIIICLRKSECIVERISVYNVIEKLIEHGILCLPCSYTNDVIDLLRSNYDVILIISCHGTKHNNWLFPSCYGNRSVSSRL